MWTSLCQLMGMQTDARILRWNGDRIFTRPHFNFPSINFRLVRRLWDTRWFCIPFSKISQPNYSSPHAALSTQSGAERLENSTVTSENVRPCLPVQPRPHLAPVSNCKNGINYASQWSKRGEWSCGTAFVQIFPTAPNDASKDSKAKWFIATCQLTSN